MGVMQNCRLKSERSRIRINRNFAQNVRTVITCIYWQGQASEDDGDLVIPDFVRVTEVVGVVEYGAWLLFVEEMALPGRLLGIIKIKQTFF